MKKYIIYILFLVATTAVFVAVEYKSPRPIDWTQTFSAKDKIPYGTKAIFDLLEIVAGQAPKVVREPMYNLFSENKLPLKSSYINIADEFLADSSDIAQLCQFAAKGNQVFLAASDFGEYLLDTLHLRLGRIDHINYFKKDSLQKIKGINPRLLSRVLSDTIKLNFVNSALRSTQFFEIPGQPGERYIVANDTTRATVLGVNKSGDYNFLKIPFGKGSFYLHCVPEAFSNYFLLAKHNEDYSFAALSYLPKGTFYWDEYAKQGRNEDTSVLRFFMSNPALAWAINLSILGIILFMIFQGKRTQRIIPIINPVQNTSLEFMQTIGNLYYQQQDHGNVAQKKIQHFWTFVRTRFGLQTNVIDEDFKIKLAQKSGFETEDINALLKVIERTRKFGLVSEYQLIELNNRIDEFYKQA
jgi:hypothetical protein